MKWINDKFSCLFVGQDGMIKLSDRARLPYTEAVLHETLRMRPVAPLGLPHTTACDTKLRKYCYWPDVDILIG